MDMDFSKLLICPGFHVHMEPLIALILLSPPNASILISCSLSHIGMKIFKHLESNLNVES